MEVVDQVFFMVMDLLDAGFGLVMPVVMALFALTFGAALIRVLFAWLAGDMGNMMGDIIVLLVLFFTFLAIATNAKALVDGIGAFSLSVGTGIVGAGNMTPDDFGPSALWGIGSEQAEAIMETKRSLCTGAWECTKTLADQLLLELAAICIYAAFAFLLFEMAVTILGYKITSLFALLFTPMALLPFTKSLSEGGLQGWANHLVKMTIIAMVAGIASRSFELMDLPETPVFEDIIPAVLLAVFIAFMAWQSRTLAASIISATPQLSGQAITRGVGNIMRAAAGGAGAASAATALANREKHAIGQAAANFAAGAQRAPGRVSAAAAAIKSGDVATKAYWSKVRSANSNAGSGHGGSGKAAGSGEGSGGSSGASRTGGSWDGPPSDKQKASAAKRGVDIGGMTRGEASVALEKSGMDPAWNGAKGSGKI